MSDELIGKKLNKGISTIEILIAFMVLTLCIGAVILLNFSNQSISTNIENRMTALALAQELLAGTRSKIYADQKNCDDSTPCSGTNDPFFHKKINIDTRTITECAKNITSSITRQIESRPWSFELETRIADFDTAIAMTGDCATLPPDSNWNNPEKTTSVDTNPALLKATGLDEKNGFVYMSVDPSLATDPDFFIFNDETPATQITALNTGPGLSAVDVAGSYAYVANDSKNGQLQIIDISDPYHPILKTTVNVLPSGTDVNSVGNKVFYYDSKIYLGLKKNNYAEFYVIDTTNLNILGSYEVGASINAIYVKNNYAFIATPNTEELSVIDVNPSSSKFMKRVGGFDAPAGSGNGKSLQVIGNTLYLGRTVGNKEFYILNIENPTTPLVLGSYDANSSINDLVVVGEYAFLITGLTSNELQILNIANPENITLIGKYNFTDKATNLDYANDKLFISSENQDALIILKPTP